jgi:hypothetical protein
VLDEVKAWQARPLDELYPISYLDALVVKVRDGHQVRNKAAHIAVGVDLDGVKHVLGIWVQATEGSKFWAGVCAELANRGIRDVLVVCCDGLTGFPEAIEATWPRTTVQTCVVHLIRASMRFVSYKDRKRVAAALRLVYTAPTVDLGSQPFAQPHRVLDARSQELLGGPPSSSADPENATPTFGFAGYKRSCDPRATISHGTPWRAATVWSACWLIGPPVWSVHLLSSDSHLATVPESNGQPTPGGSEVAFQARKASRSASRDSGDRSSSESWPVRAMVRRI